MATTLLPKAATDITLSYDMATTCYRKCEDRFTNKSKIDFHPWFVVEKRIKKMKHIAKVSTFDLLLVFEVEVSLMEINDLETLFEVDKAIQKEISRMPRWKEIFELTEHDCYEQSWPEKDDNV